MPDVILSNQRASTSGLHRLGHPELTIRIDGPEYEDGNIESMRIEHLYHLTAARSDIAQFIALPFGYWFRINDDISPAEVGFDEAAITMQDGG